METPFEKFMGLVGVTIVFIWFINISDTGWGGALAALIWLWVMMYTLLSILLGVTTGNFIPYWFFISGIFSYLLPIFVLTLLVDRLDIFGDLVYTASWGWIESVIYGKEALTNSVALALGFNPNPDSSFEQRLLDGIPLIIVFSVAGIWAFIVRSIEKMFRH